MRALDFHVHIGRKEDWHPWVHDYMREASPALYDNFESVMSRDGLEELLRGEGVDRAVILAENCPITTGVVTNDFVAEFCAGREFYIPFATVHPGEEDAVAELERCVKDLGFRGLKMYPPYQHFFPNDRGLYPLYDKACELDIPVMFHTGSSVFKGTRLKYADPMYLDDLAVDFPRMRIVMAHSGRGAWYDSAFLIASIHPNAYMEVSGLPPRNLLKYFPNLSKVARKVIFGSDWPGVASIRENIAAIRGLGLGEEAVEDILWRNAARVLGLGR